MTKLTLSINPDVSEAAKLYAKRSNTSVSKLVENYLIRLLAQDNEYPDQIEELIGYAQRDEMPASVKEAKLEYLRTKSSNLDSFCISPGPGSDPPGPEPGLIMTTVGRLASSVKLLAVPAIVPGIIGGRSASSVMIAPDSAVALIFNVGSFLSNVAVLCMEIDAEISRAARL